jgi:tripartite-type tricarboxylate transporter receptor subunit TctC
MPKANPGKINMGSGGTGTTQHLAGELFKMMTGITMVHVPYRGSALSLTDLIGGQVQVTFDSIPASIGYISAGRLRAPAVTAAMRSDVLPEIPTIAFMLKVGCTGNSANDVQMLGFAYLATGPNGP